MDWTSNVAVHESALPQNTRARILAALKRGELDPSLLYSGLRQTLRWTHLHHAFSPAQRDPAAAAIYESAFQRAANSCQGNVVHVVSLACGDGTKDTRCLQAVRKSAKTVLYTPADVSLEMVLAAEQTATSALRGLQCAPLVCELAQCTVLPALLKNFDPSGAGRIVLFLGTIHNFWPPDILRSVIYPVRSQDQLLVGANLAPSTNYDAVLPSILEQYDNGPTRHWLMGALSELSLTEAEGRLEFSLEPAESDPSLKRIQVDFIFSRRTEIPFYGETISFNAGQKLRVFYSYRFTVEHLRECLARAGLTLAQEWIDPAGQEGVFLCQRPA